MNNISLSFSKGAKATVVSNIFIDNYMPQANGTYVKIYIYLLRCISDTSSDLSLSSIADKLDETEKDIMRALKYWEENAVLSVKRDSCNRITDITFLNLEHTASVQENVPAEPALQPAVPACAQNNVIIPLFADPAVPAEESGFDISESSAGFRVPDKRPTYSEVQVAQLLEADEIKWLLQMLERNLQRLLKPADIQLVLFFYECLNFNADLILYLYEYCISRGKKSNAYIEKVAISWAGEGITSAEQAKEQSASRSEKYLAVLKAFGLNRNPAPAELQYMKRWFETYAFDAVLVTEACNRTVLAIGKPDFKYADRILESWYKNNVHTTSDLQAYDRNHAKGSAAQSNIAHPFRSQTSNIFNRFPQRKYTEEDYSSMEQRLLNKQQG